MPRLPTSTDCITAQSHCVLCQSTSLVLFLARSNRTNYPQLACIPEVEYVIAAFQCAKKLSLSGCSHISAKKIKIPHWVTRFGQSGPSTAASWFKYSNGETMSEYAGYAGIRCNQPKASSRVCQGRPHIRLFSIRERPG